MEYATLFGKTRRDVPKDIESINGQLLFRGGFTAPVGSGIVTWLPLGLRVVRKVADIVREEMNAVGCQELLMPALHPKEYWTQTGRWENVDILFRLVSQTKKEYALGASHEEIVTPLAASIIASYRDLPVAVYQVQTKFRDELRAKGGVLRGREFLMKDAYSFHATREDFESFYARMLSAYRRVYERCGVPALEVRASGGIFTENPSDEFHVETPSGEDRLLRCTPCRRAFNAEIAPPDARCPDCSRALSETKGIEVGNTFDLGTKYADACNLTFTAADGSRQPVIMGCYGIGVTRLVGAIVETHHDARGILWPSTVAPYDVHIIMVRPKDRTQEETVHAAARSFANACVQLGHTVLMDDRPHARVGEQLADADLIGIPYRVVVSERSIALGGVELKARSAEEGTALKQEAALQVLRA